MKHQHFEQLLNKYHGLGDLCGAKTRKSLPCMMQARQNDRCRFHGGMSTGVRTQAGREAISQAQKKRWAKWRKGRAGEKASYPNH